MKLHRLRVALLLAAVLFGQWLGFAHASQHEVLDTGDAVCSYCVSGLGSAPPPAHDGSFILAVFAAEKPHAACAAPYTAQAAPQHPIRGPPLFLS